MNRPSSAQSVVCLAAKCSVTREIIRRRYPVPRAAVIGASPLTFLDDVPGFHKGALSSPYRGRFSYEYDELVQDFESFVDAVQRVFASDAAALNARHTTAPSATVSNLYADFALDSSCQFLDLLDALDSALGVVLDTETGAPVFQTVTLEVLPLELLEMVVGHAEYSAVLQFSLVSRYVRGSCTLRMSEKARFAMRFDGSIVTHTFSSSQQHRRQIGDSMTVARSACADSADIFLDDEDRRRRVKSISFDNEWERMCPASSLGTVLPSPYITYLFGPLYDRMKSVLILTLPYHLCITSLGITPSLLALISRHPSIRSLSLRYCFPATFRPVGSAQYISLTNIVFLAVGFGGRPRCRVDPVWRLITHFSCLRHLVLFGCDPDDTVDWPWEHFDELPAIRALETLHLHRLESDTFPFLLWLEAADAVDPGRLSSLKLHTTFGINTDDFDNLVIGLASCGRTMRILVLDALHDVRPDMLGQICAALPRLEGLSIFKRPLYDTETMLYTWDFPGYEYARALAHASCLRHFESNMSWSPFTYTPRTLDTLLDNLDLCTRGMRGFEVVPDERDDLMDDGRSVVLPFAAFCPRLESFVIRASLALLSCSIYREIDGAFEIAGLRDREHVLDTDRWNPTPDKSWGQAYREPFFPCPC